MTRFLYHIIYISEVNIKITKYSRLRTSIFRCPVYPEESYGEQRERFWNKFRFVHSLIVR